MHIKKFLADYPIDSDILISNLQDIRNSAVAADQRMNIPESLNIVINDYVTYAELSLTGAHGKTTQFYMQYIHFVNLFFSFSRSIRNSDFELYVSTLYEISNLFFVMNQPNYARWSLFT